MQELGAEGMERQPVADVDNGHQAKMDPKEVEPEGKRVVRALILV